MGLICPSFMFGGGEGDVGDDDEVTGDEAVLTGTGTAAEAAPLELGDNNPDALEMLKTKVKPEILKLITYPY